MPCPKALGQFTASRIRALPMNYRGFGRRRLPWTLTLPTRNAVHAITVAGSPALIKEELLAMRVYSLRNRSAPVESRLEQSAMPRQFHASMRLRAGVRLARRARKANRGSVNEVEFVERISARSRWSALREHTACIIGASVVFLGDVFSDMCVTVQTPSWQRVSLFVQEEQTP